MIAAIFEVWPGEDRKAQYLDLAQELREDLQKMDGFVSVERFLECSGDSRIDLKPPVGRQTRLC